MHADRVSENFFCTIGRDVERAAYAAANYERPNFDRETLKEIIRKRDPLPPPSPQEELFGALNIFKDEIVVLLVSVKDVEGWAVLDYMSPPKCSNGQSLYDGNRTINFYNSMGNTMLTLGMFGEHRTALLWAKNGGDSRVEIENALQLLPNVQLVAGVGEAYGLDRENARFGDVLVSTTIDGIGNVQWDDGSLTFDEGDNRYTRVNQRTLDVFATAVDDWATVTNFQVTKNGRAPKVYANVIISIPWFINDANILEQVAENNPLAIGGETEGQVLAAIRNDRLGFNPPKEIDVIVIKGVSEFAGGSNVGDSNVGDSNRWSLTAAIAATAYMEFKLEQTRGQVCKFIATHVCIHQHNLHTIIFKWTILIVTMYHDIGINVYLIFFLFTCR